MKILPHAWTNGGDNSKLPTVSLLDNGHVLITSDADADSDGSPRATDIDTYGTLATSLGKPKWCGEGKYVNSEKIPYFVLPMNWFTVTGVRNILGDIAKVSYKGKTVYCILADYGPSTKIGELSICAIEALGFSPWNLKHTKVVKGIPQGVTYEIIPSSSRLNKTVDNETIQQYGQELFSMGQVKNNPNAALVLEASKWIGVHEKGGNNKGPEVEMFQKAVDGKASGEAWCMAFVQYCIKAVEKALGVESHIYHSEHCLTTWQKSNVAMRLAKPEAGCVVIWQHGTSTNGHTGFVTSVEGDKLHTVEGNTADEEGINRDGDGVYSRTRNIKANGNMKVVGFLKVF